MDAWNFPHRRFSVSTMSKRVEKLINQQLPISDYSISAQKLTQEKYEIANRFKVQMVIHFPEFFWGEVP